MCLQSHVLVCLSDLSRENHSHENLPVAFFLFPSTRREWRAEFGPEIDGGGCGKYMKCTSSASPTQGAEITRSHTTEKVLLLLTSAIPFSAFERSIIVFCEGL